MRILRVLCIPFSQQSVGTEPLALPDLTHLKPLPCPVSLPYQPLHVGPPPLPYPLALQALPCQALLHCPVLRPYHPLQVRHPSSTQSLGPTTPHRLGLHYPCPPAPAFALPALTGASPLFNDLCYNTCLLLDHSLTYLFPLLLQRPV